jgi:hypothetical protein
VRNRVAPKVARTRAAVTSTLVRMSVVMTLVPALAVAVLVTVAQPAAAASEEVAVESGSSGLAGPVGIAAVAVGFGGLVVGLLRHRRRVAGAAVTVRPPVEQRTGERAL